MLFLAGMIIATIYDYQIASALTGLNDDSGVWSFGTSIVFEIAEIIGYWTTPVLAAFSAIVTEINFRRKLKEKGRLIFFGASTVFSVVMTYYGSYSTMDMISGGELSVVHHVVAVITAIVIAFLIRFVTENINKKTIRKFFCAAFFTLIAIVLVLCAVEGTKILWGRMRFAEIVKAANENGTSPDKLFRPWYIPDFFSGGHSFPSGHAAQTTALLTLPLWLGRKDEMKKKKFILTCAISVWIAFMCFSRLCVGAHFLSDVLCGFAISYVIIEITYYFYNKTYEESFFPFETTHEVNISLIRKEFPQENDGDAEKTVVTIAGQEDSADEDS